MGHVVDRPPAIVTLLQSVTLAHRAAKQHEGDRDSDEHEDGDDAQDK